MVNESINSVNDGSYDDAGFQISFASSTQTLTAGYALEEEITVSYDFGGLVSSQLETGPAIFSALDYNVYTDRTILRKSLGDLDYGIVVNYVMDDPNSSYSEILLTSSGTLTLPVGAKYVYFEVDGFKDLSKESTEIIKMTVSDVDSESDQAIFHYSDFNYSDNYDGDVTSTSGSHYVTLHDDSSLDPISKTFVKNVLALVVQ